MSENGALQDIIYGKMNSEVEATWNLNIIKGKYFNTKLS